MSRRGGSNFLGRMIQDMYEKSAGRMRIYPATWVLEQCKNIIREKGCKYGNTDKLISRDDLDGKRMILVNVRGVHCPDESRAGRFPRVEGGYSIFFSECKVCRNYKPKDRFPICKLRRADNPAAATLNGINDVFKKASDSFNEMMGNHGPEDRLEIGLGSEGEGKEKKKR